MPAFKVVSDFGPAGDQPAAIAGLAEGINRGDRFQTLLGITGSGKSATIAWTIQEVQRPTLVIAPNKSLAAQLANEFKEFFPHNRVEYFVSYYDYYQPEAYIPSSDTYIEKDSSINDEIDRLRHSATSALLTRRDVIVVASVSCIYGLGNPEEYRGDLLVVRPGEEHDQRSILRKLVEMNYERNDMNLVRGKFRVRGDTIEVHPAYDETAVRIELFGDEIEQIIVVDPLTGERITTLEELIVFPATHYVAGEERLREAVKRIEVELQERLAYFEKEGKLLEAQRLRMRTQYDLEMMQEVGYCSGIENYSGPIDGRSTGEPPYTLLDYFPDDFLCVLDESHVSVPQLHGQYEGDRSRKDMLIQHGFRLPSTADNRPLRFDEFVERVGQVVFLSATPSPYELQHSSQIVEQIVRPTGLVDPEVIVKPTKGQIDDLMEQINLRVTAGNRVLVTTLTKKMAEDLTDYLLELGVRVRYLHSEVDTIQRIEILRDLRLGEFDVLVGINLLREGLDLPEVTLVAILDADKEGFLRSGTSLIQMIGRAARNVDGQVIMYADKVTDSMQKAISETNRRRGLQQAHNAEHGIDPQTIRKAVTDILATLRPSEKEGAPVPGGDRRRRGRRATRSAGQSWPSCRTASSSGSSAPSKRRCTTRPPTSGSSTPPGCGTRSRTSTANSARLSDTLFRRRSGDGASTASLAAPACGQALCPPPRRGNNNPRGGPRQGTCRSDPGSQGGRGLADWTLMTTTVVGPPVSPSSPLPRSRPRLVVLGHGAALAVLYVAFIAAGNPQAWSGSDAGGKVATVRTMAETGTWTPDVGYWAEAADPSGAFHPLVKTVRAGDQWVQATSLPLVYTAVPLWKIGGAPTILLVPILGALLAAMAARQLARNQGATSGWAAFWLVGAGTPVLFYAADFWEHAPALGLFLAALALLTRPEPTLRAAIVAGLSRGGAATLRAELALYVVAFGMGVLLVGECRRAWLRRLPLVVASGFSAGVVVLANTLAERAVVHGGIQTGRVAAQVSSGGDGLGDRFRDDVVTTFGLFSDTRVAASLTGVAAVGALVALGLVVRLGGSREAAIRAAAVAGAAFAVRFAAGLGFIPGTFPAAPSAAAGLVLARTAVARVLVVTAVAALPAVWYLQWRGDLVAQWGGRYTLASGVVLTVLAARALESRGLRTPGAVALIAITVAVSVFGAAWHVQRTRQMVGVVHEVDDAPADVVTVSMLAHLGREAGAFYGDRRWLRLDDSGDGEALERVLDGMDVDRIDLVEPVVPGWEHPELDSFRTVSERFVPYLQGVTLRVVRMERAGP